MDLKDLIQAFAGLSEAKRPIRLRLLQGTQVLDDVLLVKRVTGSETLCGGLEYRLLCISTRSDLPAVSKTKCNTLSCRVPPCPESIPI